MMSVVLYFLMVFVLFALIMLILYVNHVRHVVLVKDIVIVIVMVAYLVLATVGIYAPWRHWLVPGLLGVVLVLRGLQLYTPLGEVFEKEVSLWK